MAGAWHVYVGCRTTRERTARGRGLKVYRQDGATGAWAELQLLPGLENPSFLASARHRPVLYAVHGDREQVSAFAIAPDGRLIPDARSFHLRASGMRFPWRAAATPALRAIPSAQRSDPCADGISHLNTAPCGGRNPVHLATTPDDRFLLVANHLSSTVALLRLEAATGAIGAIADLLALPGESGPHRVQQPFAKPHQVAFDPEGRHVLVPDKGVDRTFTLRIAPAGGRLELLGALVHRPGSGPRHVAFTPDGRFAYVLNEIAASILACRYDPATGGLDPFQLVSSVPEDCTGPTDAAEIAVSRDGRFVYASNRGHDSIGVLAIEAATGRLTPVQWIASGGRTPRFFALDPAGRLLFAANEDSDCIGVLAVDADTGRLSPTGRTIATESPVCILFRPAP